MRVSASSHCVAPRRRHRRRRRFLPPPLLAAESSDRIACPAVAFRVHYRQHCVRAQSADYINRGGGGAAVAASPPTMAQPQQNCRNSLRRASAGKQTIPAASSSETKAATSRGEAAGPSPPAAALRTLAHSTHPGRRRQQSTRRKTPPGGRARPRTAAHRAPQCAESHTRGALRTSAPGMQAGRPHRHRQRLQASHHAGEPCLLTCHTTNSVPGTVTAKLRIK